MSINSNPPHEGTPTEPMELDPDIANDPDGTPVENPSG